MDEGEGGGEGVSFLSAWEDGVGGGGLSRERQGNRGKGWFRAEVGDGGADAEFCMGQRRQRCCETHPPSGD